MSRQQPIHVVVEKKGGGCFSGCGATFLVLILLGLSIEYWYVTVPVIVILVAAAAVQGSKQSAKNQEQARHRPGPRDPWLNEVAVALADLGLREIARNTGAQLGGVQIDGDLGVQADRLKVYVTLFSDQRRARDAELGLRAKPEIRNAIAKGFTAITTVGRVVYVANGRGGVVDEFRLDEIVRVVGKIPPPPPLLTTAGDSLDARGSGTSSPAVAPGSDASTSCAVSASCGRPAS